jgi:acetyl esterase/lipase
MVRTIKQVIGNVLNISKASVVLTIILLSSTAFAVGETPGSNNMIYKTVGERELRIYIDYPPGWKAGDSRPGIIFFFGGGWFKGMLEKFKPQAKYFASRGMVAARADYRVKSRDGVRPDECVKDARSAVRWMRQNARKLGIDPEKLITSGGSAGGHLAACMMIPKSVEADSDDLSISTIPQAMVLFNPALNFHDERIIGQLNGDKKLADKISPTLHMSRKTPPALILFGTEDKLKIHGEEYWKKAEALGVRADKYLAEGQGHGFFNRSPWRERTLIATDRFLASLGFLEGEPTIREPEGDAVSSAGDAKKQERPRSARRKKGVPERAGVERGGRKSRGRGDIKERFTAMDKDGDGNISLEEVKGRMKKNFGRIDSDSDGFIDRKEFGQFAKRLNRRRASSGRSKTHPDVSNWQGLFTPDLSNAVFPEGIWTFENSILTASKDQVIWTAGDYDNFTLDLEFKTDAGTNSGVIVYCSDTRKWIPNSVEIQIADDYAEKWAKSPGTWHCGAIFGHLAPSKSMVKKPGEWNRFTITCLGQKIEVVLNGEHVTSMDMSQWTSAKTNPDGSEIPKRLSKPLSEQPTKGKIGLQGKHAGRPIWFRNIKIKELK